MSPQSKFAYTAAMLDAEGCICLSRCLGAKSATGHRHMQYDLRISVSNKSKRLINWLVQQHGGFVRKHSSEGCFEWHVRTYKGMESFLLSVLPYMIVKNEQALLALEYVRLGPAECPQKREQIYFALRSVKREGSPETNMPGPVIGRVKIESGLMGDHESAPTVM